MQKYGNSGDNVQSLNSVINHDGREIEHLEFIREEDSVFAEQDDPLKKDLYEQLIKDCVFSLMRGHKISKIDAEVLLHSHGIDEYFPKKTAMEISEILKIKNTEVRTRRFVTAKKVADYIRICEKNKKTPKYKFRFQKRITIRLTSSQYDSLSIFCQTMGKKVTEISRMALIQFINSEFPTHERMTKQENSITVNK